MSTKFDSFIGKAAIGAIHVKRAGVPNREEWLVFEDGTALALEVGLIGQSVRRVDRDDVTREVQKQWASLQQTLDAFRSLFPEVVTPDAQPEAVES